MSSTNNQIVRRIAIFGATRGVGLETLLSIIHRKDTSQQVEVHLLVRSENRMVEALKKEQVDIEALLKAKASASTKVTIFEGDALKQDSVDQFFQSIIQKGQLNEIVSSLGSLPDIIWYKPLAPVQFPKGMEEICSRSMHVILQSLKTIVAPNQIDKKVPTFLVVSSNGIGKSTHECLPFLIKNTVYGKFLEAPHADKGKMERELHETFGLQDSDFNPNPKSADAAFPTDRLIIVRPSLLTCGKAKLQTRSSTSTLDSAWSISRKDVGAFITGDCLQYTDNISKTPVQGGNGYVISY